MAAPPKQSLLLKKTLRFFLIFAILCGGASLAVGDWLFRDRALNQADSIFQAVLDRLWDGYRHYYLRGGRVIRPKNGDDTVSEGQAYAMLRAVWLGDRATFDAVYQWTEENLSRVARFDDHLLAWHYIPDRLGGPPTIDYTPALDADLDYALALFLAAKRWPDQRRPIGLMSYRDKAVASATSIMAKAVYPHPTGELVLLPWPLVNAAEAEKSLLLNPSYFSPGHYRVFARETGDARWNKLIEDTYRQVNRLLGPGSDADNITPTVPDWILMTGDGSFAVDPARGYISGWDAFRLWWRLRVDYDFSGSPAAKDLIGGPLRKFLVKSMADSGGEVASESNRDGTPKTRISNAGMTAAYGWSLRDLRPPLSRTLCRQAAQQLKRDGDYLYFEDRDDYYTNSWAWYAMVETGMRFPFLAYYRFDASGGAPAGEQRR